MNIGNEVVFIGYGKQISLRGEKPSQRELERCVQERQKRLTDPLNRWLVRAGTGE